MSEKLCAWHMESDLINNTIKNKNVTIEINQLVDKL